MKSILYIAFWIVLVVAIVGVILWYLKSRKGGTKVSAKPETSPATPAEPAAPAIPEEREEEETPPETPPQPPQPPQM